MDNIICIECPLGCDISVEQHDGDLFITGNACPRGERYARQEATDPRRVLTTTVFIQGATHPMLPVKSARPLPKDRVDECLKTLANVTVRAPVQCGDIVCSDICDTGIDIVATRTMEAP
jgi:CxxC motif-containing protein